MVGVFDIITKLLKKLLTKNPKSSQAQIIARSEHCISRQNISPNALRVLYRLKDAGYNAYLVGGCVRDLLLGNHPKDFDVATDAKPEQVKKLFHNCLLIGKRFRLAHIRFGKEIIEVATFRAAENKKSKNHRVTGESGMLLRDNIYGTLEEDVWRRDFTVNALYYNIADYSIVDYCNGINDLNNKILRLIGNPEKRYQEDPVRLLRIIRFAGKLGFEIAAESEAPIKHLAPLLQQVASARLFDETLKIFHSGYAKQTAGLLQHYQLFTQLFPTENLQNNPAAIELINLICANTDARIQQNKSVTPAFLFSGILWYAMLDRFNLNRTQGMPTHLAMEAAIDVTLKEQVKKTSIPRRFTATTKEIWVLQFRLERRHSKHIIRLLSHPRFRAAYDLLLLRAQAEPSDNKLSELSHWWTVIQETDREARQKMIESLSNSPKRRRRKRKVNKVISS